MASTTEPEKASNEYQTMSSGGEAAPMAVVAGSDVKVDSGTYYNSGDVAAGSQPVDLMQPPIGALNGRFKRGHKCCGGCCDVRRAVIVVDIIRACLVAYGLTMMLIFKYAANTITNGMDDDAVIADFNKLRDMPIVWPIILCSIFIVSSLCGIVGAIQYNIYLVAAAAVPLGLDIVLSIFRLDVIGLVTACFFLYPHVYFIKEVREGIMSKETIMDTAAKALTTSKTSEYQSIEQQEPLVKAGVVVEQQPAILLYQVDGADRIVGDNGSVLISRKRGHKCCGGCCDVRRAVIIVDIIRAALSAWSLLAIWGIKKYAKDFLDDDEVLAEFNKDIDGAPTGAIIATILIFQVMLNMIGIYGAMQYNVTMVAIATLPLCWDIVYSLFHFDFIMIIVASYFLYPHIMFIKEVRQGIMSAENYDNERFSCCCV